MITQSVLHNEVLEINGIHNCPDCGSYDLRLDSMEYVDTGDEGITIQFKYICRKESRPFDLVYYCRELNAEELAEFYDMMDAREEKGNEKF
jgi:hypothetical protein